MTVEERLRARIRELQEALAACEVARARGEVERVKVERLFEMVEDEVIRSEFRHAVELQDLREEIEALRVLLRAR